MPVLTPRLVLPARQVLPPDVLNTHTAWVKASKEIAGLMLITMDLDIQNNLEQLIAYDMLNELKMFYIDNLERLGHATTQNLSVSLIMVSLRKEYDGFVQNYNMHSMGKTMTELHAMLKLHEQTLPPREVAAALHAIRAGRIQKNKKKKSHKAAKGNQEKGKAKMGYAPVPAPPFAPKPKNPLTPKKDNPAKDAICHQCGEVGHWRKNCPIYLVELMKKKKLSQGASTSGIFTKELYSFPSTSWVYDTGYGTHVCITTQGLRGSRKLKPGALSLYVGDGHRVVVKSIGEFHLCLPSRLVLYAQQAEHYIDNLERLGHAMTQNLSVSLILVSLRKEYDGFVQNYNMHSIGKTVTELHVMLKLHEQTLPPKDVAPALHAIRVGRVQKNQKKKSHKADKGNQGKGKANMGYAPVPSSPFAPKPKNPPTPNKDNLAKNAICHQCGEVVEAMEKFTCVTLVD
ncbi:zinc finger, CCHC-type containing protein [Tanacetum coccineum]